MDPIDGTVGVPAFHERLWSQLMRAVGAGSQRTSIVLLTGTSGAGKTKAACDIGINRAFFVMLRVFVGGLLTTPCPRLCRETVVRAQQQEVGHQCVRALFAAQMRAVVANDLNVSADGFVTVPDDTAMARLAALSKQLPAMDVVWCHGEAQVLLDIAFDNLFEGTFVSAEALRHRPLHWRLRPCPCVLQRLDRPPVVSGVSSVAVRHPIRSHTFSFPVAHELSPMTRRARLRVAGFVGCKWRCASCLTSTHGSISSVAAPTRSTASSVVTTRLCKASAQPLMPTCG